MTENRSNQNPKRFYKTVSTASVDGGWRIELDGRVPKTPARADLIVPTEALAQSLAEEWDNQKEFLDPARMTLTRLANVAIDRMPLTRSDLIEEFQKYAGTDLLCYLTDHPAELKARQEAHFRPLRDWAGREHGVMLMPTEGVMNAPQPPASIEAAGRFAETRDDFALTGLMLGLTLFGSAILSMAVADGELSALDAFDISRVDEIWQIEHWGEDEEAATRVAGQRDEAEALGVWFSGLN